jgi:hypothetical protein
VVGYVSIDSPHQGASIAPSLQKKVYAVSTDPNVNGAVGFANFMGADMANDAKEQWQQLSVPAAHEMLFGHYYAPTGQYGTSNHQKFYQFLEGLGRYRKDIQSASIAYSNFYVPHAHLQRPTNYLPGYLYVTAGGFVLNTGHFGAGGNPGTPESYELMPGSTGDWYFSTFKCNLQKFVYTGYTGPTSSDFIPLNYWYNLPPSVVDYEFYKGTFIPIQSALDLSGIDSYAPATTDEAALAAYSPFGRVYYMKEAYNSYKTEFPTRRTGIRTTGTQPDDQRYQHIVFGQQLMNSLSDALDFIATHPKSKFNLAAINLLLQ